MLCEPFSVSPNARIVDNDRVVDTVGGVVYFARVIGVNELNDIAVCNNAIVLLIRPDGALKRAMD